MSCAGNRRGHNLRGQVKPVVRGQQHYAWKGDAARTETKRSRCQKMYQLGQCERCLAPATERHHKDGNTGNNDRSNVELLCRRCHMTVDGRLAQLAEHGRAQAEKQRLPPRPCVVCTRAVKVLRKGRCGRCSEYLRRHGEEWTPDVVPGHGKPRLP